MREFEIGVIGAGINGVLISYFLLESGFKNIALFEKRYPGSGGTFRCATGIRPSFTSREHVEAMKRSIELWDYLSKRFNFEYRRDGYLWILNRERDVSIFEKIIDFQRSLGLQTRFISPEEIREIVPYMNTSSIIAGVYDPLAGKADNFKALLNILNNVVKNGVKLYTNTFVNKIIVENSRLKGIETSNGFFKVNTLIVASGTGSRDLLKTINIDLPIENVPKHALITEAYKYCIKPLIIDWSSSSYFVQVFHGGLLIGAEMEEKPGGRAVNKISYLYRALNIWIKYFPWLAETHVLRYWTGYYDMTPDHHPIIGPVDEVDNLYLATGFSGHGFMMAPAVAESIRDYVLYGKPKLEVMENMKLERFRKQRLIKEIIVFG